MARFLHQVLVQDAAITVSTTRSDDLPVNPLSMILYTVKVLNDTGTLTNFSLIRALLAQVSKLEVLYQGAAIMSGSLADLARLSAIFIGRGPRQSRIVHTDNDIRSVTIPILLGRKPYWPEECFPAVRRGELVLQSTFAAAQTGIDNVVLQAETIELLEAKPMRYLKATTISKTPSATGDHDVDLPIGNMLVGILGFGTTPPSGTSYNASLGQLRLLIDNAEAYYARTNYESLNGLLQLRSAGGLQSTDHTHLENTAALYTQSATTDEQNVNPDFFEEYVFLDLDPHMNGMYALDTKGLARVHLRINQEPTADAIRILPVELVAVAA